MYQFMYFVRGIFIYFYSLRFREFISVNTMKFRKRIKRDVQSWPAAKITMNPNNINIVVRVLSKKFLLSFDVGGAGAAGGCCCLGYQGQENQVEVGSYIFIQFYIQIRLLNYDHALADELACLIKKYILYLLHSYK